MSVDKNARLFEVNTISGETAESLLSSFAPSVKIAEFCRIAAGGSTSNYKIVTNSGSAYLLRIYPDNNDHSQMEMAVYSYAKKLINVPEIYYFDESKTTLPNTYVFMQFIEGITFREYTVSNMTVEKTLIARIGKSLSLLHNRRYDKTAFLKTDLSVLQPLGSMYEIYERYLEGISGRHLCVVIKQRIYTLINEREDLLFLLDGESVLSHGDFNHSNIIIDKNCDPWFVDFEYCFSAPRYCDIGKFFRTKDDFDVTSLRDDFIGGYASVCNTRLSDSWWVLSKLAEIQTLLALMNREILPEGWVGEIEKEIDRNMAIVSV